MKMNSPFFLGYTLKETPQLRIVSISFVIIVPPVHPQCHYCAATTPRIKFLVIISVMRSIKCSSSEQHWRVESVGWVVGTPLSFAPQIHLVKCSIFCCWAGFIVGVLVHQS